MIWCNFRKDKAGHAGIVISCIHILYIQLNQQLNNQLNHLMVTHTKVIIFPESVTANIFPQSCWHLLKHVWVFLVLNSLPDERLSKHRAPGLLIFIIHASCRELFSWMGWDFVTGWKNGMLFIYKNRGATMGDIICASPAPGHDLWHRWWCHQSYSKHIGSVSVSGEVNCATVFYITVSEAVTLLTMM